MVTKKGKKAAKTGPSQVEKAKAALSEQRGAMVDALLASMERDGIRWTKGWSSSAAPYNYSSGTRYHGGNRLWLTIVSRMRGYDDPRWITPGAAIKMARERGERWEFQGEQTTEVVYYKEFPVFAKDDAGNPVIGDDGKKKVEFCLWLPAAVWHVLNLAQIKGAPALEAKPLAEGDFSIADGIISSYYRGEAENSGVLLKEGRMYDRACYSPLLDRVEMPAREDFFSVEEFTSTLAHETIHSSGHPSRLNRDLLNMFGSEDYAYEELIAEIGSVMLCADLGIEYGQDAGGVENHAAYLKSWMAALREEDAPEKLAKAVTAADRAAEYVLGFVRPAANATGEEQPAA